MAGGVAEELRTLATRVRRNVPCARDPERFHEEASGIAHRLTVIAEALKATTVAERRRNTDFAVPKAATSVVVNGRTVRVQRGRLPYRIHVEGAKP
jgi:hypothetical protein